MHMAKMMGILKSIIGLSLSIYIVSGQNSFTFTTDVTSSPLGSVEEIRSDDIDISNGYWEISVTNYLPTMSLRTRINDAFTGDCSIERYSVFYDASHSSEEGDIAIIITVGDEYISLMFDYDAAGVVVTNENDVYGSAIYPACSSTQLPQIPNDSSDSNDLFDASRDTNSYNNIAFWNFRDRMASGNRNDWSVLSWDRVDNHDGGFNVGLTINYQDETSTVSFWTQDGQYSASCSMNTVFSKLHGNDVIFDYSPDYASSSVYQETWQVHSITINRECDSTFAPSNSPSNAPTNVPTNFVYPSGCDPSPCSQAENVHCQTYRQGFGCINCEMGYWTIDETTMCTACQDVFGDKCASCEAEAGCNKCLAPSVKLVDAESGVSYCSDVSGSEYDHCSSYDTTIINDCYQDENCDACVTMFGDSGCLSCKDGYYRMAMNMKCQSCSETYPGCTKCNDYAGCVECSPSFTLTDDTVCNDEICV